MLQSKSPLPSLEYIQNLTEIKEIDFFLKETIQYEDQLNTELEETLSSRIGIEDRLSILELLPSKLLQLSKDSHELAETTTRTSTIAENVSRKVKELDRTKERLKITIARISDILDVKNCIEGVKEAMRVEDFETAAGFIKRYRKIDSSVLEDSARTQLEAAERELRIKVEHGLENSLLSESKPDILRYLKLYAPLGRKNHGMKKYSEYLCGILSSKAEEISKLISSSSSKNEISGGGSTGKEGTSGKSESSNEGRSSTTTTTTKTSNNTFTTGSGLNQLFRITAHIIESQAPLILENFGPLGMLTLISKLHNTCDYHGSCWVDDFGEKKQIAITAERIGKFRRMSRMGSSGSLRSTSSSSIRGNNTGGGERNEDGSDVRGLAALLDNIALISQRTEVYSRFIRQKAETLIEAYREEIRALHEEEKEKNGTIKKVKGTIGGIDGGDDDKEYNEEEKVARVQERFNSLLQPGATTVEERLNSEVQGLVGHYIALEEHFMLESTKKAVSMDEHTEEMTSSMVDYVFFVLKKCGQRAVFTNNTNAVCAIINILNIILSDEYKGILNQMMDEYTSGQGPRGDESVEYMIVLNNYEASSKYILKLKLELQETAVTSFKSTDPSNMEKISSCLAALTETSKTFKKLLKGKLERVLTMITPSLKRHLSLFTAVNYNVTEEEFSEYEINDPCVEKFIEAMNGMIYPFKEHLTETNYESLVIIIIKFIATRLEVIILQKKFNLLGALQFDKDLRVMITYFSKITNGAPIRGEFAKLNQAASLLNLERVEDVLDYWGTNSDLTWRLTPSEVRKVLSRRVEFRPADVAALRL